MKYAVIDTETSGLFDFSKPADAEGQPRLAHLGMILVGHDLTEERTIEHLVKPDGWRMPDEAAKINGLTTETMMEKGIPIQDVLTSYVQLIDDGYVIVAFNAQYDTKVMRGELRRLGWKDRFENTPNICVMRALVEIVKVPKAKGRGFKFPKLSEACAHFNLAQDAAHSAMGDARSALELFRKLHELRMVPIPMVHFAK
jgi:DNA polymerase-3 subunit epsilon